MHIQCGIAGVRPAQPMANFNSFFGELRRRNVVRVAGVYAVVGWVLVQIATTLEESMGLPPWFDGMIVALLLIGLPVALIFAWAFELTPEGIVRTEDVPAGASITRDTGRKLDYAIIAGIVVLAALIVWQRSGGPELDAEPVPTAAPVAEQPAGVADPGYAPLEKSIAVLPFENRSPNADDAFFADGMHDDLLTHLSKIAGLHVISRTSVMGYAGSERRLPDIARELGVATIMEGAVQRAGKRVRINVQLIDAQTDDHLWAEIYDRELTADNIFDIQSEITKAIAAALDAVLSKSDESALEVRPTTVLAAYDNYMSGRLLATRYYEGEARFLQAIAAFDRAIQQDPEFGEAYAGRAYTQIAIHWYTTLGGDWLAAAEQSLQKARALAPDAVETLTAEGYYYYWGFLDYARADKAFARALAKSPNYVDALAGKAFVARRDGRYDDATALLEKAYRLDPLNVDMNSSLAETYTELGRFAEARTIIGRAQAIGAGQRIDPSTVASAWEYQGNIDRAWQAIMQPIEVVSTVIFSFRARFAVMTRDRNNIEQALASWPEELRSPGAAPEAYAFAQARALMVLGENDAAQRMLGEIKARIDAAPVHYPRGWKANVEYYPVDLPGLMGDLDGVRAAEADFQSYYRPDAWGEPPIHQAFADAYIRAGDLDAAFAHVDKMVALRGPWIFPRLAVDVAFDPVRNEPRYLALQKSFELWAKSP
jgi:TolB-like protein/Tfp pilus assembly protein PilF